MSLLSNPWFLTLTIGLPIVVLIAWMRVRQKSRASSLRWRLALCVSLACVITPVPFSIDDYSGILPAIIFAGHPEATVWAFCFGYLPIAIVSSVLFGIWSLVRFIRKARHDAA